MTLEFKSLSAASKMGTTTIQYEMIAVVSTTFRSFLLLVISSLFSVGNHAGGLVGGATYQVHRLWRSCKH
jgi:hypothetical protein